VFLEPGGRKAGCVEKAVSCGFFFFFCEGSILEASCSGCGGSKVITDVRVASGVRTSPLKGGGLSEGAALLDFGFPSRE
jgi:hypothetical protein